MSPEKPENAEAEYTRLLGLPASVWFLLAALAATLVLVFAIHMSRAWDPYVCRDDRDCRGLKRCMGLEAYFETTLERDLTDVFERYSIPAGGRCMSPEVYRRTLRQSDSGALR